MKKREQQRNSKSY